MGTKYLLSKSTMLSIRAASGVLQAIGIVLSLFRLWFRLRIRRFWWEDAWSFVACICAIVLLTADWMYLEGGWLVSVVGFWIYALLLSCVVWAVRMSILFSIARIAFSTERMRRLVTALATFFSLIFVTFTVVRVWWYTHDLSWLRESMYYTKPLRWLPRAFYICELCTDCIADSILIALPVRLLWSINLPPKQRRMIIAVFCATIIVTMVSIIRGVFQLAGLMSVVGVATDFEAAFSTINCNLLVIATLIYRVSRRASDSDVAESDTDDDYTIPADNRPTPPPLTTVELSALSALNSSKDSSQLVTHPICLERNSVLSC